MIWMEKLMGKYPQPKHIRKIKLESTKIKKNFKLITNIYNYIANYYVFNYMYL